MHSNIPKKQLPPKNYHPTTKPSQSKSIPEKEATPPTPAPTSIPKAIQNNSTKFPPQIITTH